MNYSPIKTLRPFLTKFLLITLLLTTAISCGQQSATAPTTTASEQPQSLSTVTMSLADHPFVLQLAATDQQREIGLMYRENMPADQGMIFTFTKEDQMAFWMKNTHIPLDIVFINHQGRVVAIQHGKPFDLTSLESGEPAQYVIELNDGAAARAGLKVGDNVKVPQEVTSAAR